MPTRDSFSLSSGAAVRVRPHLDATYAKGSTNDPHVFDYAEIGDAARKHREHSNNSIETTRFTWWNIIFLLLWINFTVNYYNWITLWVGFFQFQILDKTMYLMLLVFCLFLLSLQLIIEDIKR